MWHRTWSARRGGVRAGSSVPATCTYTQIASWAARFFRTPLGGRTAVGFTSAAALTATLGSDPAGIRLSEPALRALAAPLGVTALTVDPQFSASAADLDTARERTHSRRGSRPRYVDVLRVTGVGAVLACLALLIG
ncbi:SAV_915 family protein [Streptomyces sp. NPDC087425]|uniref:SAV_915 family protein n=1 Tax=Streptomyces sp. NPDC087425 TaxID=3365787 RepID=UPI0038182B60